METKQLLKGDIVIKDGKKLVISEIEITRSGEKLYTLSNGDFAICKAKNDEFETISFTFSHASLHQAQISSQFL